MVNLEVKNISDSGVYEKFVQYCCVQLGLSNIDLTISFKTIKLLGYVSLSGNINEIVVNKKLSEDERLGIIAHELTHLKQILDGELKTEKRKILWQGKEFISAKKYSLLQNDKSKEAEYRALPWEKEAFDNELKFIKEHESERRVSKEAQGGEIALQKQDEVSRYIRVFIEAAGAEQQGQLSEGERWGLERKAALQYARENDCWFDDLYSLGEPFAGGGNENTLSLNLKEGIFYKSNNLSNNRNSILQLFGCVKYHNEIFELEKYEFVGFTGHSTQSKNPYIEPIFKQHYVLGANHASQVEIDEYMKELEFEKIKEGIFKNDKYIVSDLRPRNVLKDEDGNICVIDDIVRLNMKEENKEQKCINVKIVNSDKYVAIKEIKNKFKKEFKTGTKFHIKSIGIDVFINNKTSGEMLGNCGIHKANALLWLDKLIESSIFERDDIVKEGKGHYIESCFWVKNCVYFTDEKTTWDFSSLIQKHIHDGKVQYIYYGSLKIRKD